MVETGFWLCRAGVACFGARFGCLDVCVLCCLCLV